MPSDSISFEAADLQLWEKITLAILEDGRTEEYSSRIQDITQTEVIVSTPIRNGMDVPLLNNAAVRVIIQREDGFLSFTTFVTRKTISGPSTVHLQRPDLVERNQRRNYLRVPVSFPVAYLVLPPEEEEALEVEDELMEEEPLVGAAVDLGGGGIAVAVDSADGITAGSELVVGFSLSDTITHDGLLTSVVNVKSRLAKPSTVLCLMFADIDEKDREAIIRYTVAQQRALIRLGKILR